MLRKNLKIRKWKNLIIIINWIINVINIKFKLIKFNIIIKKWFILIRNRKKFRID
jgi:hypothetical protein